MPAKALPIIVAAVVATGFVIYNNREQIVELYERGREKLAQSLHKIADHVGPRQRETPHGYPDHGGQRSQSFDDRLRREEEAEGFSLPYSQTSNSRGRTSGRAQNTPARYRQRNPASAGSEGHVLYDLPAVDRELPPPPLPPRRNTNAESKAPSESGYGSERTAIVSPAVRPTRVQPQSSPLAKEPELLMPSAPPAELAPVHAPVPRALSPPAPVVPIAAAAVVAGAAVGTTAAIVALTPEVLASLPAPLETLPHVQSPPSIPSSSSHSEPDIIPPNPFESTASYMSTQEWINNTNSCSSDGGDTRPQTPASLRSDDGSVVGAGEIVGIPDVVSEFGSASEGDFDDAASWTELGSQTSENDY